MSRGRPLEGCVALVAGATRGAGRGIAVALGEAGATVYCTGRSSTTSPTGPAPEGASPFELEHRPETIEETAALVAERGGTAVARRVDHTKEVEVAALAQAIQKAHGRLDVCVNDIWGGDALTEWGTPLWELDIDKGRALFERGTWTHVITSRHMVPLLLRSERGLLVEITDGDSLAYRGTLFYDLVKTTAFRLAFAAAEELRERGVTVVALTPGFLRSEAMLEHLGVGPTAEGTPDWRGAVERDPHFAFSETPSFIGRAVAALAADPERFAKTGKVLSSWGLAREYGFSDEDGERPDWGRHADAEPFGDDQRRSHARYLAAFEGVASSPPKAR